MPTAMSSGYSLSPAWVKVKSWSFTLIPNEGGSITFRLRICNYTFMVMITLIRQLSQLSLVKCYLVLKTLNDSLKTLLFSDTNKIIKCIKLHPAHPCG